MTLDLDDVEKIQVMLKEIKDNQRALAEYMYKQEEKVRIALEDRSDRLLIKIDSIQHQVDEIRDEQSKGRETTLRYIISVIVSVCVGGFLEFLLRIK